MKGVNFNLILQFISFYILRLLFNTLFEAEKKNNQLNFAVHYVCWLHTLSHGTIWLYLITYSLMQRNSQLPNALWMGAYQEH